METMKKLKMALAYLGISEAELARRMDVSPQSLHQRLKTGKLSDADFERIAAALGCDIVLEFRFPDGTVI